VHDALQLVRVGSHTRHVAAETGACRTSAQRTNGERQDCREMTRATIDHEVILQ
jgi:hypothetical protein